MAFSTPEQPIWREIWQGSRDIFPLVVGAIPFGIIFGTLSARSGLSFWGSLAMSALVFAGSAQFIALGLLATGANLGVLWLTTLVVNLRHLLYSVSLIPHVKGVSRPWKILIGFGLTDEGFVATIRRFEQSGKSSGSQLGTPVWYYLGAAGLMYLAWQVSTLLGLTVGQRIPDAQGWGLDFAMSVTFIGMTVPYVVTQPMGLAVLSAGGLALLTFSWPHKLGLIFSVLVGVMVGHWMETQTPEPPASLPRDPVE